MTFLCRCQWRGNQSRRDGATHIASAARTGKGILGYARLCYGSDFVSRTQVVFLSRDLTMLVLGGGLVVFRCFIEGFDDWRSFG